jgi:hypothetical protein
VSRCPPELLGDLARVLAHVRTWTGIVETRPGVFYLRRQPFLHFHLGEGGRRQADVKGHAGWTRLELPRPLSAAGERHFTGELRSRYEERSRSRRGRAAPA